MVLHCRLRLRDLIGKFKMKKKLYTTFFFIAFWFSSSSQIITQAEYFWDTDPGLGNGLGLTVLDGNFNQSLETVISSSASLPTPGNHVFHIRIKDNSGNWSPVFRRAFKVLDNNLSNLGVKITLAEYFWDTDPGEGNGFPLLAFDGNFTQAFETVSTNSGTLPGIGNHVLYLRVKANDGLWSPSFRKVFHLVNNNNTNLAVKITQGEYYWDEDPGFGNGFSLLAFDGNFTQALEAVTTSMTTLPTVGNHLLYLRVKANDGSWSPSFRKVFKFSENNNTNLSVKITKGEFFWDDDPGFGNGFPLLAFDGNFSQAIESVFSNSANLPTEGEHLLNLRVKADDGFWGPNYRKVFKLSDNNNTNLSVKISQAEYFWDTDPGVGNGSILLAFDGNFDKAFEVAIASSGGNPGPGVHVLHTRYKAADGNWGGIYKRVIGLDILYDSMVTLVSPTNASTQVPLSTSLVWNTFTGAGNYEYVLSTDPTFSTVAFTGIVNGTTILINGLSPSTIYYWRVRVNESNNVSLWSAVWSFTTTNSLGTSVIGEKGQTILYPVPADNNLFVKQNVRWTRIKYKIFSIEGKFLNEGELLNDSKINVSHLSSGVYLIELVNDLGQSEKIKFSKM